MRIETASSPETPTGWTYLRPDVLAVIVYAVLAVLFTWPLAARLHTHVIGPFVGDNYEYVWKMWWVPHALQRGLSPFFNPDMYYPHGYELAYGEITPVHTFLLAPLTLLLGHVTTYNLSIMASIVLSGWLTYRLTCRWLAGGSPMLVRAGALFAGVAFAFSAYRTQRIAGHLPLVDTQWLVLAILGLDRWLERRQLRDALLTGLAISLAALSSWYYAFMLAILLPVYLLAACENLRALLVDRRTWLAAGVVIAVVGTLCTPFLLPYLRLSSAGQASIPLLDASFWAASPLDYLVPNPRHPLWGQAIQQLMWPFGGEMPVEFAGASVGWITLFLGGWAWRKVRGGRWRGLKWVMAAAFTLSLGPILHLGRLPLGIPLPAMLLRLLPFASGLRSWGRFSVFVMLGMSVLAGAGLTPLLTGHTRLRQCLLAGGLTAAALLGAWIGPAGLVPVGPRPVDTWLAEQPGHFAIMEYPLSVALSGPSMLYTMYHGRPVVFGYGTYFPFLFRERHPELAEFPADPALDLLQEWDVRYVLIATDQLDGESFTLADVRAQPRLRHVVTLDSEAVYEIVGEAQSSAARQ